MLITGAADGLDPAALANPWLQAGLPGAAVVALAVVVVLFLRRDWKARDQDQATIAAQQKFIQEQAIPALVRATDAGGRMTELTDQNIETLTQVREVLAQVREQLRDRRST